MDKLGAYWSPPAARAERLLPPEPAEHANRPPDPADAQRRHAPRTTDGHAPMTILFNEFFQAGGVTR